MASRNYWLDTRETVLLEGFQQPTQMMATTSQDVGDLQANKRVRPRKHYAECPKCTQQRKRKELADLDESMASALSDRSSIGDTADRSGTAAVSVCDVLSLIVKAKLTKHQYTLTKEFVQTEYVQNRLILNVLPSYKSVLKEKENCYHKQITVRSYPIQSESCAEVKLQALFDQPASRILDSQKEVLDSLPNNDDSLNLCLVGT